MLKKLSIFSLILATGACTTSSYLSGQKSNAYQKEFVLSAETVTVIGIGDDDMTIPTAVSAALSNGGDAPAATLLAILSSSDVACEDYMSGMVTSSNTVISILGISNLALSGAASLTSPTRSANLLSGVATFAGGTKKELSDTALGGKSPVLIYKSVAALRKKERARIIGLAEQGLLFLALSETADYHAACGPTVGLNALEAAVEQASSTANDNGAKAANAEASRFRQLLATN